MELKWVVIDGEIGGRCLPACHFLPCCCQVAFPVEQLLCKKIMMTKGAYLFRSVGVCFSVLYLSSHECDFLCFKEKCLLSEMIQQELSGWAG